MSSADPKLAPPRYSVRPLQWGDRRRYALVDGLTDVVLAIRSTRAGAENEAIVLNLTTTAAAMLPTPSVPDLSGATAAVRTCSRCREEFPAEAGQDELTLKDWWLCPPCHLSLMGGESVPATGAIPGPGLARVAP